jgi:hypothetical protein
MFVYMEILEIQTEMSNTDLPKKVYDQNEFRKSEHFMKRENLEEKRKP